MSLALASVGARGGQQVSASNLMQATPQTCALQTLCARPSSTRKHAPATRAAAPPDGEPIAARARPVGGEERSPAGPPAAALRRVRRLCYFGEGGGAIGRLRAEPHCKFACCTPARLPADDIVRVRDDRPPTSRLAPRWRCLWRGPYWQREKMSESCPNIGQHTYQEVTPRRSRRVPRVS